MANVTDNEERYLRQILLIGKGGCLVLRAFVNRERDRDGRSLEDILKFSKTKLQKCLLKFQFNYIFPSATDVNADIETWDISLLISIISNVFGHVSQEEKDALNVIRNIRNNIQGHHSTNSLTEEEYNDLRLELNENILKLASDKTTKIECYKIISYSGAGQLTNGIVLNELNALHAFEGDQLSVLNERLGEPKSNLECIGEEVNEVKNKLDTFERNDGDRHAELTGQLQRIHMSTDESKQDIKEIKGNTRTMEINQQERHENLNTQLQAIDEGVQSSNQALTEFIDKSSDHTQLTRNFGTVQGHMHEDVLEAKALASASCRTMDVVQETVSISRDMSEQQQEQLNRIEEMMTELMVDRGREQQHDIEAIINANSERSENATEAQATITTSINDILEELRSVMEDRNNAEAIMQKVDELLLREESRDNELTKALLELIKDIMRHGNLQQARKGSVKLTVRFTSYSELFSILQYLSSEQFQDRLNDISRALKNMTGNVVTLSGYIAQESLNDLHTHLEEECKNLKCTRSVVLPVQCKGIVDLSHIWKLLQTGGADMHMKKLSEILTKMVGGTVTLTTSVNLKQFEQALLEERGTSDHFTKRGYGSGLTRSERKQTESAQKYKPHLEFSLTEKYSVKYGSDKFSPVITGIELLPDGKILLSDHWNSSLKLLDSSFNIVSYFYFDLSGCPWDMCYIGNDIVAVSLGWAGIRFARVSNDIKIENQENGNVCSLAFHGKTLYILDMYCKVYRSTAGGLPQRIPYKIEDISKNYTFNFDNLVDNKIAVSDDGEMIYLTLDVGLVTIDNKGNHISTLRSDELRRPVDVCVVGDGTILVAYKSNNVFRVDGRGTSILGKVSLTKVHLTAICYDRKKSRLIVGENSGYIHVFELQK